jgi:hypothetical protein
MGVVLEPSCDARQEASEDANTWAKLIPSEWIRLRSAIPRITKCEDRL